MKFPCELIAEPYIAQLRINIARNLRELDYTQMQIAELLQVSQPVVSGYLKKGKHQENLPPVIVSKATEVASDIAEILHRQGKSGTQEAINRGCYDCKIMRQSGPTCVYHRSITSNLDEDCTSCLTQKPLIQLQENKQGVITQLSTLYNYLISFDTVDKIIPEIGMQIILSIDSPESMSDIAAFPSRIIKRKSNSPLADPPIFGGSETTSQLLLELNKQDRTLKAIAALKTTDWLITQMNKLDLTTISISGFEENMRRHVEELELKQSPFAIIGKDSIGFESITYFCASDITKLRSRLESILN